MTVSNIKNGYKQTEIGVIPEDWQNKKLEEICHLSKIRLNPVTSSNNFKCVELEHLSQGTGRLLGYIDSSEQLSQKTFFKKGDVLFGKLRPYLKKFLFPTFDGVCSSEIWVLNSINNIESKWLYYLIQTDKVLEAANQSTGTKMPRAEWNIVGNVSIPIPPTKAEQSAIATALSDTDSLISSLEQLIAKKRAIKQGAMEELLTGKRRLNHGLNGLKDDTDFKKSVKSINPCQSVIQTIKKGYKQTEVGVIPEDWEVRELGEIGNCIIGLTYKPENIKESGILVLRSSNIGNNTLKYDDNVFVDIDIPDKLRTKQGDILICVRNGSRDLIGKCALIDKKAEGETFGAFMSIFRTPNYKYVFHQFTSDLIKRQIYENIGATINQITNKNLNSFKIPIPPTKAEQTAIAEILSDMDTEIESLEQKLEKYKKIKQGMMQELLTGRTRFI